MILTQDSNDAVFQIKAYQPGAVTVNDTVYNCSLIIASKKFLADWQPRSLQELKPEHWLPVLEFKPEVVLFGTGVRFQMPAPQLLAALYEKKIRVESMDTGAACRTYMALAAEGRDIVAALLIA